MERAAPPPPTQPASTAARRCRTTYTTGRPWKIASTLGGDSSRYARTTRTGRPSCALSFVFVFRPPSAPPPRSFFSAAHNISQFSLPSFVVVVVVVSRKYTTSPRRSFSYPLFPPPPPLFSTFSRSSRPPTPLTLSQQLQHAQSELDASSAVDEQGRLKLFSAVSRASVSFFFFLLMWRTVHHYELADATFAPPAARGGPSRPLLRAVVVTPLVVLFLGEMVGAILGLTGGLGMGGGSGGGGASHATKRRLKGVLNLHKTVELAMMAYNVVRLAVWPSRYVMREVYIGRTISNFFFLMQAQLYTKLSW